MLGSKVVVPQVQAPEYWGVFPLFFMGDRIGVTVKLKNQSLMRDALLRVCFEYCYTDPEGKDAGAMGPGEVCFVTLHGGQESAHDLSLVSKYGEIATTALCRLRVLIYDCESMRLIMVKEGVFCPLPTDEQIAGVVGRVLEPPDEPVVPETGFLSQATIQVPFETSDFNPYLLMPVNGVIRDEADWTALAQRDYPARISILSDEKLFGKLPSIDFGRRMLVFTYMGIHTRPGYRIVIHDAVRSESRIYVIYETIYGAPATVPEYTVFCHPCHAIVMERSDLPVEFVRKPGTDTGSTWKPDVVFCDDDFTSETPGFGVYCFNISEICGYYVAPLGVVFIMPGLYHPKAPIYDGAKHSFGISFTAAAGPGTVYMDCSQCRD